MDIMFARIEYENADKQLEPIVNKEMHHKLGIKEDGYYFSKAYRAGVWDGIKDFYDKETRTFPLGLISQVEKILGELQSTYRFQFEIIDDRPDKFMKVEDMDSSINVVKDEEEITLWEHQYASVKGIIENQTGMVDASTNSGKSFVAAGLIDQITPYLESDETIAFFTSSKEIFKQNAKAIEDSLGIKVGRYDSKHRDIRQVTFVMIPTMSYAIKKSPEEGIKLTEKERRYKRIAKEVAPKFIKGFNQRSFLMNYIKNYKVKTKADQKIMDELEDLIYSSGTDNQLKMKLKNYQAEYQKVIEKKNGAFLKKHQDAIDFLESIAVMIVDEAHHTTSDTWYQVLTSCKNAQYRMALTGSIDTSNKLLWQRMRAVFGDVTTEVSNEEMIEKGISAKPKITIFPILSPTTIQEKDYHTAYDLGIVQNDYRNSLIAKLIQKKAGRGDGVLAIVNRIDQGETISNKLDELGVSNNFIHGELEDDERDEKLQAMRDGTEKVLISSSILDEGVDISGIDTLVLGAGGKSLRQTLQRVGRGLRKKKTGENKVDVYDFMDYTNKFLKNHSDERKKIYLNEGFEVKEVSLPK